MNDGNLKNEDFIFFDDSDEDNFQEQLQMDALKAERKQRRRKISKILRWRRIVQMCIIVVSVLFVILLGIHIAEKNAVLNVGKAYEEIRVNSDYEPYYYATTFFDIINLNKYVKVEGEVNTEKIGTYELKFSLFGQTVTKIVEVKDTEAPKIKLIAAEEIEIESLKKYLDNEPEVQEVVYAIDNYDPQPTIKNTQIFRFDADSGETLFLAVYEAKDQSENKSSVVRRLKKIDKGAIRLSFNLNIDSYDTKNMEQILHKLKSYNISATFFIVGDLTSEKSMDFIHKLKSDGHTVLYRLPSEKPSTVLDNLSNDIFLIREVKKLMEKEYINIDLSNDLSGLDIDSILNRLYTTPNAVAEFDLTSKNNVTVEKIEGIISKALYDGYHFESALK